MNRNTVESIIDWFMKAVPNPSSKNIHTQLGVHFEEVAEMLTELRGTNAVTSKLLGDAEHALTELATHLKKSDDSIMVPTYRMPLFLDSLCDQVVTATGVARMYGLDFPGALEEVDGSNWSKFVEGEPIFDDNMKIKKGPNYSPPDMTPFI